ncbi:Ger(x)C family spore germination protein [Paenibacillus sp. GYB003]|uniref:Ger(x)C family spore germination protein n=1 Tax=Paenibacillus sp. GYB003 TaxID=2994392 RepID=UPI002F963F22
MRSVLALLATVVLILATGCTDEKVLEKVGFLRSIAYDTAGEDEPDKLRVTVSIPLSNQKQTVIYSTIASTSEEAMLVFNRQNNREIVKGQLRQVLIGETLAKKGIWEHVGLLMRDPSVGSRVHVIVVEGDTQKLLSRSYAHHSTAGEYIDNLIRTVVHTGDVPDTNIHRFMRDYYDDGIEPVATIIRGTAKHLVIDGIALFKRDRMVGRVEPDDKTLFGLLYGNVRTGKMFMDLSANNGHGDKVSLNYLVSDRKVTIDSFDPQRKDKPLKATVRLKIRGSLLEYIGDRSMQNFRDQRLLEAEMTEFVRRRCQELLELMQKCGADSIGIGQHARNKVSYEQWKRLEWNDVFSKADIRVVADVKIKDFGKVQ